MQRQRMTISVTWDLVRWHLTGMYGKIQEGVDGDQVPTMRVSLIFLLMSSLLLSETNGLNNYV